MVTGGEREPDWARWARPLPTATQRRRDVWVALAVLGGGVTLVVLFNSVGAFAFGSAPALWEQLLWVAALTLPLALRRRFPLAVLVVISVAFIAAQARQIADNNTPSIALFLAMFTVGAWERNRVLARWFRVAVIAVMFGWLTFALFGYLVGTRPSFDEAAGPLDPVVASVLVNLLVNVVYFLAAYGFGSMAWLSARREAELEYRAHQLRISQEQNTRGALVAERLRIARDLHDVVAHHVSVMGVQAGAARRVLDRDPALARTALQTVEETARTAIGELRGLLGVLRAEHGDDRAAEERSASPGLGDLPDLVSSARSAGLEVRQGTFGAPRPVPDSVALSAYRVVQEALTNVVKHSGARTAEVRVRYLDAALEVEVTDDGHGPTTTGEGFGLVGMRERVAVHGGELEAGPRRGAGYRVRASLPVAAAAESPEGGVR